MSSVFGWLLVLALASGFVGPHRGLLREQRPSATAAKAATLEEERRSIVVISGFEAFNVDLYRRCAAEATRERPGLAVSLFSDRDLPSKEAEEALASADAVVVSLIFDFDVAEWLASRVQRIGTRLVFESALELQELNQVGTFQTKGGNGPPPAVKFFTDRLGKEEDKFKSYLKLLKVGPPVLRYVPGDKAKDLKTWLELYGLWNEGGQRNVAAMLGLLDDRCLSESRRDVDAPAVATFPAVGLTHPDRKDYSFETPRDYLDWWWASRGSGSGSEDKDDDKEVVALLLFRKHVATEQPYVDALIRRMEALGVVPVPIFIAGVEAHTVVRDWLQPRHFKKKKKKFLNFSSRFEDDAAATVDAVVNTIGFPLVGGPAGTMKAGRDVPLAEELLKEMDSPYVVAGPLLLQDVDDWRRRGVSGLQSVVLYALPELDGATDPVVLGGLTEGGKVIELDEERVDRLVGRVRRKVRLKKMNNADKRIAVVLYGYPPNVGAVGTAALLDVAASMDVLFDDLATKGYDLGGGGDHRNKNGKKKAAAVSGEAIVAALRFLTDAARLPPSTTLGGLESQLLKQARRAKEGDPRVAAALAEFVEDSSSSASSSSSDSGIKPGIRIVRDVVERDDLALPTKGLRRAMDDAWPPLRSSALATRGLQLGNVFVGVQPLLGYEGDPMGILFGKAKEGPRLTPHPDYVAFYDFLKRNADAVVHFGTHGTMEWLPGQPLGNDRESWPDVLMGDLPHLYLYTANNPSEAILAKRRGLATIVSYLSPPYARSGLYLELTSLKEDLDELLQRGVLEGDDLTTIIERADKCGLLSDVPLSLDKGDKDSEERRQRWALELSSYLAEVKERLFSNGLRVFGERPSQGDLEAYLDAYLDDDDDAAEKSDDDDENNPKQDDDERRKKERSPSLSSSKTSSSSSSETTTTTTMVHDKGARSRLAKEVSLEGDLESFLSPVVDAWESLTHGEQDAAGLERKREAREVKRLLELSTEEVLNLVDHGLKGGYVPAAPGGDLLRDGAGVLPTGRNIHALDPYRMPSAAAWRRGKALAEEILERHRAKNDGAYPETVAVALWGLDAIKTRGESVALAVALAGGEPVREATGRVVRFEAVKKLGRPRVDVLCTMSGIFRDSFENVVLLLDDFFERLATLEEEEEEEDDDDHQGTPMMIRNFIKEHANRGGDEGAATSRLFSNPAGDYGSLVNDRVVGGDWEDANDLGETWASRNSVAFGRGKQGGQKNAAALDSLLETTDLVVQEVDSVEYGLTDIQEYYANTGALKKAAEKRRTAAGKTKTKVSVSVVESFGKKGKGSSSSQVKDLDETLRLEYRAKLLNPKWAESMASQGSGGVYEISQRMTAALGWAATNGVDDFVFDQAAERYVQDKDMAARLQKANPEAFKNVVGRLLETHARGLWNADPNLIDQLRDIYDDADDIIEGVTVVQQPGD